MGSNLTVDAPDFDQIKREAGVSTRDGIQTLWLVANDEAASRRSGVREAIERQSPKGIVLSPSVSQNNLDTQFATVLRFDGAASVNLTGLQDRPEPTIVYLTVIGAGTITVKHNSGSSLDRNRILTFSGLDVAITSGLTLMLMYLNTRWREIKWA